MVKLERYKYNPILRPNREHPWEALAAFNGCVTKEDEKSKKIHMVYRAISYKQIYRDFYLNLSSIGYAESDDGINFRNQRLLITPEFNWEIFGCEDPRITKIDDKYFIFYTGISNFPPNALGIKVGVAVTKDFVSFEKHPVTPFNSKAMALFPKRINGKLAVVLTIDTDRPPSKICLAYFDDETQIWSHDYWAEWFSSVEEHVILPTDSKNDQIEVGSQPIETKYGWLMIYAYIRNYLETHLFSWNDIPGKDSEKLITYLVNTLKIDWAKTAEIKKNDKNKTVTVTKNENSLELKLNEKEDKVTLKVKGGKTYDYILKRDNDKLRISEPKIFGVEAVLFDLKDPSKVIGRTRKPLIVPELEYELYGFVPNVIFPSGVLIQNGKLYVYYGSADTTCSLATCDLDELIKEMMAKEE